MKDNADGVAHSNAAWSQALGAQGPPGHLIGLPSIEDPAAGWLSAYSGYILNETKAEKHIVAYAALNVDWFGLYGDRQGEWFSHGECSDAQMKTWDEGMEAHMEKHPDLDCAPNSVDSMTNKLCSPECSWHELQDCAPKITMPDSYNGEKLTNEAGDAFEGDIPFDGRLLEPNCSAAGIASVKDALEQFVGVFERVKDKKALEGLEFMIATFESRKAFSGCRMLGGQFVIDGPQNVTGMFFVFLLRKGKIGATSVLLCFDLFWSGVLLPQVSQCV
jgi:hypothetical protein